MCIGVLPTCLYAHCMYTWCPQSSEKVLRPPTLGVTDDSEQPYGCWESNTGSLGDGQLLLAPE